MKNNKLLVTVMALASMSLLVSNKVVAKESTGHCSDSEYKIEAKDNEQGWTWTAPEGQIINTLWIKAAEDCFQYPGEESTCYAVNGLGTSEVSIKETFTEDDGSGCHDVSHIEFGLVTPTPTPETTVTPTPTAEVTVTPTVAPTATPTEQPEDNNDDNNEDNNDNNDEGGVGGVSSEETKTEEKQGQVLGASTLAATGAFDSDMVSLLQIAGLTLSSLGLGLNAKNKRK